MAKGAVFAANPPDGVGGSALQYNEHQIGTALGLFMPKRLQARAAKGSSPRSPCRPVRICREIGVMVKTHMPEPRGICLRAGRSRREGSPASASARLLLGYYKKLQRRTANWLLLAGTGPRSDLGTPNSNGCVASAPARIAIRRLGPLEGGPPPRTQPVRIASRLLSRSIVSTRACRRWYKFLP